MDGDEQGDSIAGQIEPWILRIGDVEGMDGDSDGEYDRGSSDCQLVVVLTGRLGSSGGDPVASRS